MLNVDRSNTLWPGNLTIRILDKLNSNNNFMAKKWSDIRCANIAIAIAIIHPQFAPPLQHTISLCAEFFELSTFYSYSFSVWVCNVIGVLSRRIDICNPHTLFRKEFFMRLSTKHIAATVMAVTLPIASMSAPAAGAKPTSEKPTTQQSQTSKPSTTATQPKTDRKDTGQQNTDPSAQNQGAQGGLQRSANDLKDAKDVQGSQKDKLVATATAAFDKNAVLDQGEVINKQAITVKQLSNGTFFVSTSLDGVAKGSVISAALSADGKVEQTYQISLKEESPTSGHMKTYADGKIDKDQHVTADETTLEGMDWGGLNDCLSNAGIAAWAIASLSIACGVACAATAGAGCIGCLAAASGATGGTIGFCVGKNWS